MIRLNISLCALLLVVLMTGCQSSPSECRGLEDCFIMDYDSVLITKLEERDIEYQNITNIEIDEVISFIIDNYVATNEEEAAYFDLLNIANGNDTCLNNLPTEVLNSSKSQLDEETKRLFLEYIEGKEIKALYKNFNDIEFMVYKNLESNYVIEFTELDVVNRFIVDLENKTLEYNGSTLIQDEKIYRDIFNGEYNNESCGFYRNYDYYIAVTQLYNGKAMIKMSDPDGVIYRITLSMETTTGEGPYTAIFDYDATNHANMYETWSIPYFNGSRQELRAKFTSGDFGDVGTAGSDRDWALALFFDRLDNVDFTLDLP